MPKRMIQRSNSNTGGTTVARGGMLAPVVASSNRNHDKTNIPSSSASGHPHKKTILKKTNKSVSQSSHKVIQGNKL